MLNDDDDDIKQAPTKECLAVATQHLKLYENQTMLRLQLDFLLDRNDDDINHIHRDRGRALTPGAVCLIFLICNGLELADLIKFSALEIYDRFMVEYNKDLKNQLYGSSEDQLESTNKRLRGQALLRIMSCIQLASKLNSDRTRPYMPASKVKDILKNFERDYSLSAVNSSEMRVLKTLNFKLQYVNTLEIMECVLLRLLVEQELEMDYYRRIYALSISALEFVYKQHDYVYRIFWKNCPHTPDCQDEYRKREYNKAIESAGILAAVIFMLQPADEKRLFPKIAEMSRVTNSQLMHLATVLIGILCGPPPPISPEESETETDNERPVVIGILCDPIFPVAKSEERPYLRARRRVNR